MEYKLLSEIIESRRTYGIEVLENGKRVRLISDLTENRESASMLINDLNELDARENELDYIIEDYLTYY